MAALPYRAPRLDLSFPLEFRCGGATFMVGHCLNLSESGLLGVFDDELELWTKGELVLRFGTRACAVPARVARTEDREAGLAFSFRNEGGARGHPRHPDGSGREDESGRPATVLALCARKFRRVDCDP